MDSLFSQLFAQRKSRVSLGLLAFGFAIALSTMANRQAVLTGEPAVTASVAAQAVTATDTAKSLARIRFRNDALVDTVRSGIVAVRYAVLRDWRSAGSVTWTYSDVSLPVPPCRPRRGAGRIGVARSLSV